MFLLCWTPHGENAHFIVIATFEDTNVGASEREIELSAIYDTSEDYLSEEELNYYLNLKRIMSSFQRGQIWLVNFDPSFGHKYKKFDQP